MKSVKNILKKNAVRISFSLVVIFTTATVVWIARSVIFYSVTEDIDSGESQQQVTALDRELFDAVTEAKETKTAPKPSLPTDIRDPFSQPYVPPPPEVTTEAEDVPAPPPEE